MNKFIRFLPIKDKQNADSYLVMFSTMLLVLFFVILTYSITILMDIKTSKFVNFSNFLNAFVLIGCFLFTRTEQDISRSVGIILTVALVFHFASLWYTGGLYSFGFVWTIIIICGAYFFSGIRTGLLFTIWALGGIIFYYCVEKFGLWDLKVPYLSVNPDHIVLIRVTVVIVLSIMLFVFVKNKESLQKQNKELTETSVKELSHLLDLKINELASLRDKIAQDFHDEMGNKLASITILSQTIGLQLEQNCSAAEIRLTLDAIEQHSKELYQGTKHFIWALDVKSDYVIELFFCLREFCEQFFSELNIDFASECFFEKDSDMKMETASSRQVVLVCKEIMTNAAKHSRCEGVILVFKNINNYLVIEILDDGIGFDIDIVEKRGLLNIRKRLESIDAHHVLNAAAQGTSHKLFVPLV